MVTKHKTFVKKFVCVWIGCGLEEEELLEICCLEVCWKEFVAIWKCMI